jgi:hypothetical protein
MLQILDDKLVCHATVVKMWCNGASEEKTEVELTVLD